MVLIFPSSEEKKKIWEAMDKHNKFLEDSKNYYNRVHQGKKCVCGINFSVAGGKMDATSFQDKPVPLPALAGNPFQKIFTRDSRGEENDRSGRGCRQDRADAC